MYSHSVQLLYLRLIIMTMYQTIHHTTSLRAIYLENRAVLLQLLNKLTRLALHGHAVRCVCQSDTCHQQVSNQI